MMIANRAAALVAMSSLVFCLGAAEADADAAAAAGSPSGSDKEARELFQKAEMSFNLGNFSEALADYQAAYQAKPLPAFLFNIAQCYRNMQNYERARFFYRRYLALDPRTSNRRLVEDLIADMTRLVDKAEEAKNTPAVAPSAAVAPVATLEVTPAQPAAPPPLVDARAAAPAPAPPPRPVYKRWWFWTGVGAAVAGGAVAAFVLTRDNTPQGSLGTIDGRTGP
jgi:tetratricopeptide (TPR) repeat protein